MALTHSNVRIQHSGCRAFWQCRLSAGSSDSRHEPWRTALKLAVVLATTEAETVFTALRLANFALTQRNPVRVFLVGKAVELDQIEDVKFNVREQAETLLHAGGSILACGTFCVGADIGSPVGEYAAPLNWHGLIEDVRRYWGLIDRNEQRDALQDWADLPGCGCRK